MKQFAGKITEFLGSRRFWYVIIVFFALESIWIAISARYPMAFDEDFHLGIIQVYSQQWLPFLNGQPENAAQYGALQHDPSYLYHYLMSFPYRVLSALTDSMTVQVIGLRLINVALAVWGVVLFRRVLLAARVSVPLAHTMLVIFVLIPITPLVAGQINYDNLLLPLVALICLQAYTAYAGFVQRQVPVLALTMLVVACMVASLVKYPFLPLGAAAGVFIVCAAAWHFRGRLADVPAAIGAGCRTITPRLRIVLVVAVVISGGLFIQRYGVNLVTYHTPVAECDVVLSEQQCMQYGPWARNHILAQQDPTPAWSAAEYTGHWLQALHYRSFFMVNGPHDRYRNFPPLPLPAAAAVAVLVSGLVAVALYGRKLFRDRPLLVLFTGMIVLYCSILWAEDYSQYLETGQPVAINGRYLLPILLPLGAVLGRALSIAIGRRPVCKAIAASVVIVLFLQGGGVFSFIVRSDDRWYWPITTIRYLNNGARSVLSPVIVEGSKYY